MGAGGEVVKRHTGRDVSYRIYDPSFLVLDRRKRVEISVAGADGLFSFPHKPAKGIKAAPAASIEGREGTARRTDDRMFMLVCQ